MDRLWSPWRMEYINAEVEPDGCVFCNHLAEGDDVAAHILHRGERCFVILNAFPYNTGHLMVAPLRHAGDLNELDREERRELFELMYLSVEVIRAAIEPEGFNTGLNLGAAAGAGVLGHLHLHVVPRWAGDTNFMPVTGNTKVLPETLADTAAKLRPGFITP